VYSEISGLATMNDCIRVQGHIYHSQSCTTIAIGSVYMLNFSHPEALDHHISSAIFDHVQTGVKFTSVLFITLYD